MFKRVTAVVFASIAFVAAIEEPAHSKELSSTEKAGMMIVMASVCGHRVPDSLFMPQIVEIATQMQVDVATAAVLARSQAEIYARRLLENNTASEFCARTQNVRF